MIRCQIASLVTIAAISLCVAASPLWSAESDTPSRETIKIGIFSLAPFMMSDGNGGAGGAAIDFWREYLASRMNVAIEVSGPYPIPRLEMMLETGEIDVIPYITKIPDRESRFRYPDNPLTEISSCIIVRRDSSITSVTTQKDLFGMKIGFITNAFIPPLFNHEQIELELVTTTEFREINHRKLIHGRVDALLDINHVSLMYEMNQKGYSKDIRIIPLEEDRTDIYSIFNRSQRGRKLSTLYDKVLTTLPAGTFEEITNRYLDTE